MSMPSYDVLYHLMPFSGPVPKYHDSPGSYHKPVPPEPGDDELETDDQLDEEDEKLLELEELLDDDDDCHMSIALKLFQHTVQPGPVPSASICAYPSTGRVDRV